MIKYYTVVTFFLICLASCNSSQESGIQESRYVTVVKKAEKFIQKGQYTTKNGTTWKEMPDSLNTRPANKMLYSGTPGIVLFYLELYNATQDSIYLQKAQQGADFLMQTLPDTIPPAEAAGLYTGIAGVGYTLSETYKLSKNEIYKTAAIRTLDILEHASAKVDSANPDKGIHFAGINEIVYGAAGIGLYFNYMDETYNLQQARNLAKQTANGLLHTAIDTLGGLRWRLEPSYNRFMDNFSHGTAGVAYFLAETYQKTKNPHYLNAALKASKLLDGLANDKGYIPHHFPEGEELYYLSWCHGPPGTTRLYYSLYQATDDEQWLDKMIQPANHLLNEGIEEHETPGYWNNVGKCCGAVGVAEYYLLMYQITGNDAYKNFSKKLTENLLTKAVQDQDTLKWIHAENRTSPNKVAAQTGLMQGSAGVGLWLLQLDAFQKGKEPLIRLPDMPKTANPQE